MEHSVAAFNTFLMTFLNSLQPDVIHISEHFSFIDSISDFVSKTMLHVSSITSLQHNHWFPREVLLLLLVANFFDNYNDLFYGDQ